MTNADYQAWIEVLPDFSKFRDTAMRRATEDLGAAGDAGSRAFGDRFRVGFGSIFGGAFLADIAARFAYGIGQLIGTGIRSGIEYTFNSVDLASNLNESLNALNVSFGDEIGAQIARMSDIIANRLNVTRAEFNATAVRFSAFAKTISGSDAAQVIEDIARRGADFASVFNIDVSEALQLFQSGLAGETEPLRRYGLDLSAATVEAFAHARGIGDVNGELTEAEKIRARYLLLLEQTAQVEGDLANTSGEYANQQRAFAVALEEAQTSFGQALLPIATELLTLANSEVIPALQTILTQLGPELAAGLKDSLPELKELLQTLVESAPALAELASSTLPKLVEGMQDFLEISQGLALLSEDPGLFFSEFVGATDKVPGVGSKTDLVGNPVGNQQRAPISSEDFWAGEAAGAAEAYAAAITAQAGLLYDSGQKLSEEALQGAADKLREGAALAGDMLIYGMAEGMTRSEWLALQAAENVAMRVIEKTNNAWQVRSPSKVAEEKGAYWTEGLADGMLGEIQRVEEVAQRLAWAAIAPNEPAAPSSLVDRFAAPVPNYRAEIEAHFATSDDGLLALAAAIRENPTVVQIEGRAVATAVREHNRALQ